MIATAIATNETLNFIKQIKNQKNDTLTLQFNDKVFVFEFINKSTKTRNYYVLRYSNNIDDVDDNNNYSISKNIEFVSSAGSPYIEDIIRGFNEMIEISRNF